MFWNNWFYEIILEIFFIYLFKEVYDSICNIKFYVLNLNIGWLCLKMDLICKIKVLYNNKENN